MVSRILYENRIPLISAKDKKGFYSLISNGIQRKMSIVRFIIISFTILGVFANIKKYRFNVRKWANLKELFQFSRLRNYESLH